MTEMRKQLRYIPLLLLFILLGVGFNYAPSLTMGAMAVVFVILALSCVVQDRRLARSGCRAQGTVVDHKFEEDCYFPIVEFQDFNGKIRRQTTGTGRGVKSPPVDSHVVILYDPNIESVCEIHRFWGRLGFAIALFLFGIVFGIGALLNR
jgi:hypothetical protein